ncbi:MAG: alcohol dehydrogenase catalytic domain-containing protein [Clostridiaceae bacterium]|nr:alcohol dehydrogenase catalytic domain-containing protein [Clostridiaceae bacterium]
MKTVFFDKDIPRILMTKAAAKCGKPLLFTGINAVKYRELPDPPLPAPDWIRVRNTACGVCGTDVSFFRATTSTNSALEPIPGSARTFLGHENVGVVTETGPAVTKFKVGDRVAIREYMSCCDNKGINPPCPNCAEGRYTLCLNYGEPSPLSLGDTGAGWSDSFIASERQMTKIDDALTDDQAVLVEPAAVAVHAVLIDPPKENEKILVLGCGVIGLGIVQALRIAQPTCEIWASVRSKMKQEMALRLGAHHILSGDIYEAAARATGGSRVYKGMNQNRMFFGGFDRVYDCLGGNWANHTAVRLLASRGTLVKVGHHMNAVTYDETPVWWQELRIVGVDSHGMEEWEGERLYTFDLAQRWIKEGKYRTEGFITHRFPLERYRDAFRLALSGDPGVLKIVLDCD